MAAQGAQGGVPCVDSRSKRHPLCRDREYSCSKVQAAFRELMAVGVLAWTRGRARALGWEVTTLRVDLLEVLGHIDTQMPKGHGFAKSDRLGRLGAMRWSQEGVDNLLQAS